MADAAPKQHRRMRNYLLDKGLQLRYVLFVTLISAALTAALGSFLWFQAHRATKMIVDTVSGPGMEWLGIEGRDQVIHSLRTSDSDMVLTLVGVGLALTCVLFGYLIIMTHKVAGPLYKIGLYFDKYAAGTLPKVYDLRRGDQLQDFFQKFKEMNDALRTRTSEEVAAYQRFLDACDAAAVPAAGDLGHKLDELRSLVRRRTENLG